MLTREEVIRTLPAGRNLDAHVAEEVMGWTNFSPIDPKYDHAIGVDGYRRNFARRPNKDRDEPIPLYSSDIEAAWKVVEKLTEKYEIKVFTRNGWVCYISSNLELGYNFKSAASTAPLAICRAALLAVMEESHENSPL